MTFWNQDTEMRFFTEAMRNFASAEQLFYNLKDGFFAYVRSEEHTSELQSHSFISYAVFCLKKKNIIVL